MCDFSSRVTPKTIVIELAAARRGAGAFEPKAIQNQTTAFRSLSAERGVLVADENYIGAGTGRSKNTMWIE
jgi:hypothetical protein